MKKYLIIIFLLLATSFFIGSLVLAKDSASSTGPEVVHLINPIGGSEGNPIGTVYFPTILGGIIAKVMGILGGLTLLVFVAGGFMWLTSAGNDEKVKKGTQTMVWAVIGLFIIFSSYAILNLVITGLTTDTVGNNPSTTNSQCTAKGAGWACQSIDSCNLNIAKASSTIEKRKVCDENDKCATGLCPGNPEIVCCVGSGGVQLPEAGTAPTSLSGTCVKFSQSEGDKLCGNTSMPKECKSRGTNIDSGAYCNWINETEPKCKKGGDYYKYGDDEECKGKCVYTGSGCSSLTPEKCQKESYCKLENN